MRIEFFNKKGILMVTRIREAAPRVGEHVVFDNMTYPVTHVTWLDSTFIVAVELGEQLRNAFNYHNSNDDNFGNC